jgi:hypothetical protein
LPRTAGIDQLNYLDWANSGVVGKRNLQQVSIIASVCYNLCPDKLYFCHVVSKLPKGRKPGIDLLNYTLTI